MFARWPDYAPTTEIAWQTTTYFNGFRILSYIFLYGNLFFQLIGSPLQIGRYIWVMVANTGSVDSVILNKVIDQQKRSILACIILLFTEPYEILILVLKLFYNIAAYLWYNNVWLWGVIDETFGFTRDGVLGALTRMFTFLEFMVPDYDGFVEQMSANIW